MEWPGAAVWSCYSRHGTGTCLVRSEKKIMNKSFWDNIISDKDYFWRLKQIVFPWLCILTDQCIHNCKNATNCLNIVESLPSLNRLVFSNLIRLLQVRFIWKKPSLDLIIWKSKMETLELCVKSIQR